MWSIGELSDSFRYGKLFVVYSYTNPWYFCYRVRHKLKPKRHLYIDKSEKIKVMLPIFNPNKYNPLVPGQSFDTIAEIGDLIFLNKKMEVDLIRENPFEPMFKSKEKVTDKDFKENKNDNNP